MVSCVDSLATQAWSLKPDVKESHDILHGIGNVERAISWLHDLAAAEDGVVEPVRPEVTIQGAENGGNTCYFDSLIFAMFATHTLFDGLLKIAIDPSQIALRRFQASLRLFVNQLRKGTLVQRYTANRLRDDAFVAGFSGINGLSTGIRTSQEDTTELFLWLLGALGAPYLPMNRTILHEGRAEVDDTRYSSERVLALDIPESLVGRGAIPLELLLEAFFFDNHIQIVRDVTLRRPLNFNDETKGKGPIDFGDETKGKGPKKDEAVAQLKIPALSSLKILPFYTPESEAGDQTNASTTMWPEVPVSPTDGSPPSYTASVAGSSKSPATKSLVLPMLIKRYAAIPSPPYSKRLTVPVLIPGTLRFNLFVDDLRGDGGDYVLELKSAVCHRGDSTISGHYIGIAKLEETAKKGSRWLHFDDLGSPARVGASRSYADELSLFEEMSRDGYLLIWEMKRVRPSSLVEANDQLIARELQTFEMEKTVAKAPSSWDPRNCAMQ